MGQRINPIGFRLKESNNWLSQWFAGDQANYARFVSQDFRIRTFLQGLFDGRGFLVGEIRINRSVVGDEITIDAELLARSALKNKIYKSILKEVEIGLTNLEDCQISFTAWLSFLNSENVSMSATLLARFLVANLERHKFLPLVEKDIKILLPRLSSSNNSTTLPAYRFANGTKERKRKGNSFSFLANKRDQHSSFENDCNKKGRKQNLNFSASSLKHQSVQNRNSKGGLFLENRNDPKATLWFDINSSERKKEINPLILSYINKKGLRGLRVEFSGRFSRKGRRAKKRVLQFGVVPIQTIRASLDYCSTYAVTRYGSVGIKVWLYKD